MAQTSEHYYTAYQMYYQLPMYLEPDCSDVSGGGISGDSGECGGTGVFCNCGCSDSNVGGVDDDNDNKIKIRPVDALLKVLRFTTFSIY